VDFDIQLAYIDPGTGSILFSIIIGFAGALYFLGRAMFLKLKFLITGKASVIEGQLSIVIYNESSHYWNVFKPIVEEFEKRHLSLVYLTSAKNDPFFANTYDYVSGTYIGEGNKAFMKLNFLKADICLMTTPGLEVYQLKRSKGIKHYIHILHDIGDVTCYRLFGIDWFDAILLGGEYQKNDIRQLERIRGTSRKDLIVVGSTYLDVLLEKEKTLPGEKNHQFTVLVSPSWGSGSLLSVFGERLLDSLVGSGWQIIIRPHPQSWRSETGVLERLEKRYEKYTNLKWDKSPENLMSLSQADVMISDYSGIIFDYVFLFERPVLYANSYFNLEMYDASDLDHAPWRFEVVKTFGIELKAEHFDNLKEIISGAVDNKQLQDAIKTAKETAWQYIGESGKRVADYLVSRQRYISNSKGI
jgi:hypothetical protein